VLDLLLFYFIRKIGLDKKMYELRMTIYEASKERFKNKFIFLTASFALIFYFKKCRYINIFFIFKAKTKNKISYSKM